MELRHTIAAHLRLLHRRCFAWSSEEHLPPIHWLGQYGELVALSWLKSKGYKIIKQNFRWGDGKRKGEIDLICRHGEQLVFVEVKTRSSLEYGDPKNAIKQPKRQMMRRSARYWCMLLGRKDISLRFDIVEIILQAKEKPLIRLTADAFPLEPR